MELSNGIGMEMNVSALSLYVPVYRYMYIHFYPYEYNRYVNELSMTGASALRRMFVVENEGRAFKP